MNRKLRIKILEQYDHQADFAQLLGVNEAMVSRVIRGRQALSLQNQKKWADALGCQPEEIFEGNTCDRPETLNERSHGH